jgi:DNA-binding NtrC family response regulator
METGTTPLNVLIVDDDIPLSIFFKDTLQHLGHRVFIAVNEHGALGIIKQEPIDIVICDYLLPGVDGAAILNFIKEFNQKIFCVLISGHHQHLTAHRHTFEHVDMVLQKPVLKDTLTGIIDTYMNSVKNPNG